MWHCWRVLMLLLLQLLISSLAVTATTGRCVYVLFHTILRDSGRHWRGRIQYRMNKKLSYHKETVQLLRGSVLAKYNFKTIFCGHYSFIFNHCDVIDLQGYQIR